MPPQTGDVPAHFDFGVETAVPLVGPHSLVLVRDFFTALLRTPALSVLRTDPGRLKVAIPAEYVVSAAPLFPQHHWKPSMLRCSSLEFRPAPASRWGVDRDSALERDSLDFLLRTTYGKPFQLSLAHFE